MRALVLEKRACLVPPVARSLLGGRNTSALSLSDHPEPHRGDKLPEKPRGKGSAPGTHFAPANRTARCLSRGQGNAKVAVARFNDALRTLTPTS